MLEYFCHFLYSRSHKEKIWPRKIQRIHTALLVGPYSCQSVFLAPIGMILGISGALVQSYMIARFPFLGNETVNALLVSIRSIAGGRV